MLEIEIKNADKIAALLAEAVDAAVAKIINMPQASGVLDGPDSWAARGAKLAAIRGVLVNDGRDWHATELRDMLTAIEKIINGDPTAHKHIKPSYSVLPSYDEIMRRGGAGVEERPNRPEPGAYARAIEPKPCSRAFVVNGEKLHYCSGEHGPDHPFTTAHHTCKHCGIKSAIKTTDDVPSMWHGPICDLVLTQFRSRYGKD